MGAEKSKITGVGDELYKNPRKQLQKISALKVADHIIFQRKVYEHHGIVVAVDNDEGTFDVIEYDGNKQKEEAKVQRIRHKFSEETEGTLYIVQYKEGECLLPAKVIEFAEKWLNADDYNILLNNCECMAQACKTGQAITEQARNLFKFIVKAVAPQAVRGAAMVTARKVLTVLGEKGIMTGATRFGAVITKIGGPMVGAGLGGAVEVGLATNDIHNIVVLNQEGKVNDRRRDAMIGTRVATAGGDIGGGVGGMVVGGLVAGPPGAAVGGLVGCLGGKLVTWAASTGVITIIERNSNHLEDGNNIIVKYRKENDAIEIIVHDTSGVENEVSPEAKY